MKARRWRCGSGILRWLGLSVVCYPVNIDCWSRMCHCTHNIIRLHHGKRIRWIRNEICTRKGQPNPIQRWRDAEIRFTILGTRNRKRIFDAVWQRHTISLFVSVLRIHGNCEEDWRWSLIAARHLEDTLNSFEDFDGFHLSWKFLEFRMGHVASGSGSDSK